jgi:uncharacterized protein (TIGR02453 family)
MLQKSTLQFLTNLKKNNNREWFAEHKHEYEAAKENVVALVAEVLKHLSKYEPAYKEIIPSKLIMRIYRDVRFSKNKDPYKLNFGIPISTKAKGVDAPGFYLHIQPNASFIGGGYWMPDADKLKLIRQEIDYNGEALKKILSSKSFKKFYEGLSEEDKLKTAPKDYPKDHQDIELLKLKSFTAFHSISDAALQEKNIAKKIADAIEAMQPLITWLDEAILK